MRSELISIIIPAYNEEKYIDQTVRTVMKLPYKKEVIVIDDGSVDQTKQMLSRLSSDFGDLRVVSSETNVGKGQALLKGIANATGDTLVFLDADLGATIQYAERLIQPVMDGTIDMTIAILPSAKRKGGFGFVKNLARKGIYSFTGYQAIAPLSGQRAMRRQVFNQIKNLERGFGIEVGLTIDVLRNGYRIQEIEVPFSHRETGREMRDFIHRGREFRDVFMTLVRKRRLYK